MSSRKPNPQKKQQCETCPANNRHVLKVIWRQKAMLLCADCRKAATRISTIARAEKAQRTQEEVQLKGL